MVTSFLHVLTSRAKWQHSSLLVAPRVSFNNGLAAPKKFDLDSPLPLLLF